MRIKSTIIACMMALPLFAQKVEKCDQYNHQKNILSKASSIELNHIEKAKQQLDQAAQDYQSRSMISRQNADEILRIPMVFHVIHSGGIENISESQINDAIVQLNQDFNAQNTNQLNGVEAEFQNIIANVGFEFFLASRDPQGQPTTGINRIYTNLSENGQNQGIQDLISWPREKYLNIWVVQNSDGANGSAYAYIPSTVVDRPLIDGVTTSHWAVGNSGTARNGFYKILTHEVGHWANLEHCWGDAERFSNDACKVDDGVLDTPLTSGNGGCGPNTSCESKDNFQNFMDYANCSAMFTLGQKARMRAALTSGVSGRNNLHTEENLIETGVTKAPALAVFSQTSKNVKPGEAIQFTDNSISETGSTITSWSWQFPGSETPSHAGKTPPPIVYNNKGVYDVILTVENANGETHTRTLSKAVIVENFYAMSNATVNVCDGVFYDSGITESHENNEDFVMTFLPEDNTKKLQFDFLEFNLEVDEGQCYDYLEIFDGPNTNSPSLGLYCDRNVPKNILANNPDGAITFRFVSNDNTYNPGWKANIICRDKDYINNDVIMSNNSVWVCDAKFFDSGIRTNYYDTENSFMTIYPENIQNKMMVEFEKFELEMGDECEFDYLVIYDGTDRNSPEIGKYCSTNSPGRVIATNPQGALSFEFVSDGNTNFPGWEANLRCIGPDDLLTFFDSDRKFACKDGAVNFSNNSNGNPDNVIWSFEGGTPSTSTEENPTIIYSNEGSYDVQLISIKGTEKDTLLLEDFIIVNNIQSLPLLMDFEEQNSISNWELSNPDADIKWELNNIQGYNSATSLVINNADNRIIGEVDEITSPPINFVNSDQFLEFQIAYTKYNDVSPDILKLFISTDCGLNWEEVYNKTHTDLETVAGVQNPNDWVPTSIDDWRLEQVDISRFKGNNSVQIKFQNTSGFGTRIWIDNVSIKATEKDLVLNTDSSNKNIKVYPNPSTGFVYIENQNIQINNINIFNAVGSQLDINKTIDSNRIKLDFSESTPGIYILKIESSDQLYTEKVIIK